MDAAGVAKWLRQRLVAPLFGGSNPLARPFTLTSGILSGSHQRLQELICSMADRIPAHKTKAVAELLDDL